MDSLGGGEIRPSRVVHIALPGSVCPFPDFMSIPGFLIGTPPR